MIARRRAMSLINWSGQLITELTYIFLEPVSDQVEQRLSLSNFIEVCAPNTVFRTQSKYRTSSKLRHRNQTIQI